MEANEIPVVGGISAYDPVTIKFCVDEMGRHNLNAVAPEGRIETRGLMLSGFYH